MKISLSRFALCVVLSLFLFASPNYASTRDQFIDHVVRVYIEEYSFGGDFQNINSNRLFADLRTRFRDYLVKSANPNIQVAEGERNWKGWYSAPEPDSVYISITFQAKALPNNSAAVALVFETTRCAIVPGLKVETFPSLNCLYGSRHGTFLDIIDRKNLESDIEVSNFVFDKFLLAVGASLANIKN